MSDPEGGPAHLRRRSVDVGGLALALGNSGLGHGWGGWEEHDMGETRYVRGPPSCDFYLIIVIENQIRRTIE